MNPQAYVKMRAGHSNGSITERYIHAAQVAFPGAAERAENRIISALEEAVPKAVPNALSLDAAEAAETASVQGVSQLRGWDSNPQPSG